MAKIAATSGVCLIRSGAAGFPKKLHSQKNAAAGRAPRGVRARAVPVERAAARARGVSAVKRSGRPGVLHGGQATLNGEHPSPTPAGRQHPVFNTLMCQFPFCLLGPGPTILCAARGCGDPGKCCDARTWRANISSDVSPWLVVSTR